MTNKRLMKCGKELFAWGEENSTLDKKEKGACCRMCEQGLLPNTYCEYREEYLKEAENAR